MEIYVNLNSGRKAIMKRKSARQIIKMQFGSAILSANTLLMMSVLSASTGFVMTYSAQALATACPASLSIAGTSDTMQIVLNDGTSSAIEVSTGATLTITSASATILDANSSVTNYGVITSSNDSGIVLDGALNAVITNKSSGTINGKTQRVSLFRILYV